MCADISCMVLGIRNNAPHIVANRPLGSIETSRSSAPQRTRLAEPDAPRSAMMPRRSRSGTGSARASIAGALIGALRQPVMAAVVGAIALPTIANATGHDGANRVETQPPAVVESVEAFDVHKLTEYPLFKKFWLSEDDSDGTAHHGLDEVNRQGAENLIEFARKHDLNGTVSAPGRQVITPAEKALMKTVLEDEHYGAFFELDSLPRVYAGFGIEGNTVHAVAETHAAAKSALARAMGRSSSSITLSFPDAGPNATYTSLSLNGGMAEAMKYMDQFLTAKGRSANAEAFERAPLLGYMYGGVRGHTKYGSFSEKQPFTTSGVNFGPLLFPNDPQVRQLDPLPGFDVPMDYLDRLGRYVPARPGSGHRMVPKGPSGETLKMEKVIHNDDNGTPKYWSAKFTNAAGEEVKPQDVKGYIYQGSARLSDGYFEGTMNLGWWGFCDRNSAQRLYKSKFEIPNIDRDVRIEVNGKVIEVPMAEAQKILDVDIPDMVPPARSVGWRFDDKPANIRLSNGQTLVGRPQGFELAYGPGATRGSQDMITVRNTAANPLLGSIELKTGGGKPTVISLDEVESMTKDPETGKVEVQVRGSSYAQKGELETNIDFSGAETLEDGKLRLTNSKESPIAGGQLIVDMGAGKTRRIPIDQVASVQGEMKSDLQLTAYLDFIMQNKGMYATDGSTSSVVSNGMRWVNKIDVQQHTDRENPEWLKGSTRGINGPLVRQAGDQLLQVKGLYDSGYGSGMNAAFAGWIQMSSSGQVLNQGFTQGEPDFAWASSGRLNWSARSSFNSHIDPEMRLKLFVNGFEKIEEVEKVASRLNLPSNWREHRLADPAPAPATQPTE